jgi:hydroxylamine reductase
MHMFCFQCQETSGGRGCTFGGHCGKNEETANYQDLLIHVLKGTGVAAERLRGAGVEPSRELGELVYEALFQTITNTNFDTDRITRTTERVLEQKRCLLSELATRGLGAGLPDEARWDAASEDDYQSKAYAVGVLLTENPDVRSLRETVIYGLKGIAAYAHHAARLGAYRPDVTAFVLRALARVTNETDLDALFALALEVGQHNLAAMALLDGAHATVFGTPEPRRIQVGVRQRPGILVSGHDLVDLHELLEQTKDSGIDVYTHGEMIAAHYYPKLFAFPHLAGNYGNAWWWQDVEFAGFNGPILMTSNCIVPVVDAYRDRIFTTGVAGYPDIPHLSARLPSGAKDFEPVIARAKGALPPEPIDQGTLPGGYHHAPLWAMADRLLELVGQGRLRRFVVIAGCDGRDHGRRYYREVALGLPKDTVILTAGCAKYPFIKLDLGTIDGLPRVLDAGQCNDCYSLVHFAQRLAGRLGASDINALPVSYEVCWYDQKAVAVFLTLLSLGVRGLRLGPTLPAFFSPRIIDRLQRDYQVRTIGSAEQDVAAMLAGS